MNNMNFRYLALIFVFLSMIIVGCIDNPSEDVIVEKSPEDKLDELFSNYFIEPHKVSVSNYNGSIEEYNMLKNDVINKSNVVFELANEWDNKWNNKWESAANNGEISTQELYDIRTLSKKVFDSNDEFLSSIGLYGRFVVTYRDKLSENGIKYEDELAWISSIQELENSKMVQIGSDSGMIEYVYG